MRFCVSTPGENGFLNFQEANMERDELKKILAGLCIAGLITGSTLSLGACAGQSA